MYLLYNGHKIEVKLGFFGSERILYDGKEMSNKTSLFSSKHEFTVEENGQTINYEIDIIKKLRTIATINPISYIVKRNKETILSL